jgi:hypothetical protein
MSYAEKTEKSPSLDEKHRSDGSELIPAEVQANINHNEAESIDASSAAGYTVDEENIINNYAIEPEIYPSKYPAPKQQQRYVFLGAGAILFIIILLLISFNVS